MLYLYRIQGLLDEILLYLKGSGENVFLLKVVEAYWDGICAILSGKEL
jgi:hypothetical protein